VSWAMIDTSFRDTLVRFFELLVVGPGSRPGFG